MEPVQQRSLKSSRVALLLSRTCGVFAFIALLAAWISESQNNELFGLSTQHFFNDAIVLSLFSIGGLIDAYLHTKTL